MTYNAGYKDGFRAGQELMRKRAAEIAGRLSTVGKKDPITEQLGYAVGSSISASVIETSIQQLPTLP